jgi:hypothetical protein
MGVERKASRLLSLSAQRQAGRWQITIRLSLGQVSAQLFTLRSYPLCRHVLNCCRGSIPGPPKAILHLPSAPNPKALPPQNDDIPRTERPSPPQSVDNLSDAYFAEQEPGPLNVRHGSMRVPGFQAPIPIDITLPFRDLNNSSPFPGISRLQGIVRPYPFSELDTPTGEDVESTFYAPTPTSATNPDTNGKF